MNAVEAGVGQKILDQVWNPHLKSDPPCQRLEGKVQVVGLTKLLCDSPSLLADDNGKRIWSQTLATVVAILSSPSLQNVTPADGFDDDEFEVGYDAQYSKLTFASRPPVDFLPEVPDPTLFFVQSLHGLSSTQPGQLLPLIQRGLNVDPKLSSALEAMFQQAGLPLG